MKTCLLLTCLLTSLTLLVGCGRQDTPDSSPPEPVPAASSSSASTAASSSSASTDSSLMELVGRLSPGSFAPAELLYRYVDTEHGVVCYVKGGSGSAPSCVKLDKPASVAP